jgi:hypothetical protein
VREELDAFFDETRIASRDGLGPAFRLRDMLLCQETYLAAMADYITRGGQSRGSALYTDPRGAKPAERLPDAFAFILDDGSRGGLVQEVLRKDGGFAFAWRKVRPLPEDDDFFENVWRDFRAHENIY